MEKIEVKMAVEPFRVLSVALRKTKRRIPRPKVVSVDYDEEADVLYARFNHAKIVDSESLDKEGLVVASLDPKDRIVGLIVMHASTFA